MYVYMYVCKDNSHCGHPEWVLHAMFFPMFPMVRLSFLLGISDAPACVNASSAVVAYWNVHAWLRNLAVTFVYAASALPHRCSIDLVISSLIRPECLSLRLIVVRPSLSVSHYSLLIPQDGLCILGLSANGSPDPGGIASALGSLNGKSELVTPRSMLVASKLAGE